jgi:outer membrane protein assembly factor BamB
MRNSTHTLLLCAFAIAVSTILASAANSRADWPQFRGPGGDGHTEATGLPLRWSETENIVWKTALPGRGWSSPVILGDQIWMTAAIETAATAEEREKMLAGLNNPNSLAIASTVSLRAVCVDRNSGRLLHDVELFRVDSPEPIHSLNSYASPTPVIEPGRVYFHFGTYGTACVNTESGKIVWTNTQLKLDHQNGPGTSPVLWNELLILNCDGMDVQYVAALEKHTGQVAWKTNRSGQLAERKELKKAYCTPLVIEEGDRTQLISPGADWVYSYDPATGKELWRANYGRLGFSNVARPVAGHGMVFICTCFNQPSMMAIRYDGTGDVTDSHVVWTYDRQMPKIPSPLLVGDEIYSINEGGIATCLNAKTGEQHWQQRLGGNFAASPQLADGRIYVSNQEGQTFVLQPGKEYQELAVNTLDGRFMASPAIDDKAFYLRTETHLYRVEAATAAGR